MRHPIGLVLALGCSDEESVVVPATPCDNDILDVIEEGGLPIEPGADISFVYGSQGGFHAEIGAWIHADPQVALSIAIYGDEGELIASNGVAPAYLALVDYEAATCEGWVSTRALLGGFNTIATEVACGFDGTPATVELTIAPLPGTTQDIEPISIELPTVVRINDPICDR